MDLTVIEHGNQRVLMTQQLAEGYETESQVITNNFNRNKERYQLGKHYFLLEGEELAAFKTTTQIDLPLKLNKLYLWTDKGTLLHAKSLNTDKAWEVYDMLVESYFQPKQPLRLTPNELILSLAQANVVFEKRLDSIEASQEKVSKAIDTLSKSNPDHWQAVMKHQIGRIVASTGMAETKVRGFLYRDLEQETNCNLSARVTKLQERLKKAGVTYRKAMATTKLDAIAHEKKLRLAFEVIVSRYVAKYCDGF
ncbi:toxin-antitoxin system, toxin component, Bro domain protein [Desulfitobacterium hafniense DP7]|uniref:Toxin-antitoxin system, toxin component, Bro domain protein n=1 Tax=Desulfitobacterium hafniense DP7 TaxID=537010 RepID=G9XHK9_DESHA|nr:ORF6N domain-containing protein [Desulfitobacterium hafniense]EHL08792.1 toxin-antitoxin system, toxin component, Bro domain protein [Desulfitobacterium hafniense DP7]